MVKLATARDFRNYGPGGARNKWEYINAGLYLFSQILLIGGFTAQLSSIPLYLKSGLALLLIGVLIVAAVNAHDFVAHMAGIDWRVGLVEYDQQLALVEFAVPLVNIIGSVLFFFGVLFFEIQVDRGYMYKLEKQGLNLVLAGPLLWLVGSIGSICQVYDRANGHVQILQKSVQVPLVMGCLLFLVGGILNWIGVHKSLDSSFKMLDKNWVWFGISGSIMFFIGGFFNLLKVFKMQQMEGMRLERLRGGAHERLGREREGQVPLIIDEHDMGNRRKKQIQTPYKDALVGAGQV